VYHQCVCNNGAASAPPVIPGLRTDTTGGGGLVIDLPGSAPAVPVIVPVGSDACVNVEGSTAVNVFQAALTIAGTAFQACEHSSECQTEGDCCAASFCMCMPFNNTEQMSWCV
jgi:hypothetical protein